MLIRHETRSVRMLVGDFRRECEMGDQNQIVEPDAELDLRGVICPYNFVKTKLKLESMERGQILSVLLDSGDPIRNVPQSVQNEGHTVLSQERIDQAYRVVIKKKDGE